MSAELRQREVGSALCYDGIWNSDFGPTHRATPHLSAWLPGLCAPAVSLDPQSCDSVSVAVYMTTASI